jgi:GWxTD domain-containing protein
MKRLPLISFFLAAVFTSWLAAASLPELFQKAKEEFKVGSYPQTLATLQSLDEQSSKPGLEKERAALLPGLLFYRAAALASLHREREAQEAFEAFLALKPDVELDPAVYSKPVIAAMEKARSEIARRRPNAGQETGALQTAYKAFVLPAGGRDDGGADDWASGPVRWLLSPEEIRSYGALADPMSRSEFIADFWKKRDFVPETPENEFRDEFHRRVAFADAQFAQDENRGSLTDRGMVFILLGPPSYNGRKQLRTGDDIADAPGLSRYSRSEIAAAEQSGGSNTQRLERIEKVSGAGTTVQDAKSNWVDVWHYVKRDLPSEIPFPELEFDFVTRVGYGRGVMQRDERSLSALDRARAIAASGKTTRPGPSS